MNKKNSLLPKKLSLELSEKFNKNLTKKLINSQINFQVVEVKEVGKKKYCKVVIKFEYKDLEDKFFPE